MFALFSASIVAVSSDWRSAVSGNPPENSTKVLRPGTVRSILASPRMASRELRAPKSEPARLPGIPPREASCTPSAGSFACTAENFTPATARFNLSPSEVKFCATFRVPPKSTTAILRFGEAVPSTNFAAAWRARVWSLGSKVELSKNRTI